MEQEIIDAIRAQLVVCFVYHDQPRQVNPHALGRVQPDNKIVLHGWQTAGGTNHGKPPCWGYFRLEEIQDLLVIGETFADAQPDYKPRFVNPIESIISFGWTQPPAFPLPGAESVRSGRRSARIQRPRG